jgi:hypothetical protein
MARRVWQQALGDPPIDLGLVNKEDPQNEVTWTILERNVVGWGVPHFDPFPKRTQIEIDDEKCV